MSLLNSFPHKCTIRRRTRSKGTLGGSKESFTDEQTNVECWSQNANHREVQDYEKRGMRITHKVYFTIDPGVTENHQILITEENGVAIASPDILDVKTRSDPDASAGLGVVFKVMADILTGRRD